MSGKKGKSQQLTPLQRISYDRGANHVFSTVRNRPIRELTQIEMKALLQDVLSRSLSEEARANAQMIACDVLEYANRHKLITYSVRDVFPNAYQPIRKKITINQFQCQALVSYLRNRYQDLVDLAILLLLYAQPLRIGELTALGMEDVKGNVLHIHKAHDIYFPEQHRPRLYDTTGPYCHDIQLTQSQVWILHEIRRMRVAGEFLFQLPEGPVTWQMMDVRFDELCRRMKFAIPKDCTGSESPQLRVVAKATACDRYRNRRKPDRSNSPLHIVR